MYTRVSGNMNLGLVVLSEKNEVFFQASLVTSESLATTFTLPKAGQYTIGVFRISLVEPTLTQRTALRHKFDMVAPTVFQLRGILSINDGEIFREGVTGCRAFEAISDPFPEDRSTPPLNIERIRCGGV